MSDLPDPALGAIGAALVAAGAVLARVVPIADALRKLFRGSGGRGQDELHDAIDAIRSLAQSQASTARMYDLTVRAVERSSEAQERGAVAMGRIAEAQERQAEASMRHATAQEATTEYMRRTDARVQRIEQRQIADRELAAGTRDYVGKILGVLEDARMAEALRTIRDARLREHPPSTGATATQAHGIPTAKGG